MTSISERPSESAISRYAAPTLWVALIAGLSVGGSYVYACAAPLAAVAALAATKMGRDTGLAMVIAAWFANQIVGYGLLDYPQTADSFAWGAAIGAAAGLGYLAARTVTRTRAQPLLTLALAFGVAFVVYQTGLYAAGLAIGASEAAFSMEVVGLVLEINAVAFAALVALHRAVVALSAWLRDAAADRAHAA